MFHRIDLASAGVACRLGSEAESVGQPERRSQRSSSAAAEVLRLRHPPARPERQDVEVGGAQPLIDCRPDHPTLRDVSPAFG